MKPGTWVSTHPREVERNSSVWSRNPTAAGQGIAPLLWRARRQAAPHRVMVLRFLVTKRPAKAGEEVALPRPAWTALRAVAYRPRLQDPGRKGPQNIGNTTRIWLAAILQKVSVLMCQWCLFLTGPAATPLCRLRLWRALGPVQNGLGTEGSKGEGMGSAAVVCAAAAEGHHSTTRAGRLVPGQKQGRGLDRSWREMANWLWLGPPHGCGFHPARSVHVDNSFWREPQQYGDGPLAACWPQGPEADWDPSHLPALRGKMAPAPGVGHQDMLIGCHQPGLWGSWLLGWPGLLGNLGLITGGGLWCPPGQGVPPWGSARGHGRPGESGHLFNPLVPRGSPQGWRCEPLTI